jgi:hypothetical protein
MYANLEVRIHARDGESPERVYSHALAIENGVAIIGLDDNEAEPAGERRVDLATHDISVYANF